MIQYISVYIYLYIFLFLIIIINFIIFTLVTILNARFSQIQSLSSIYECGFLPFHESRIQIEPKFFIVALSYIIFDLEICFLIPWFLISEYIAAFNVLFFLVFYLFIIIGLVYELQHGVLDWLDEKKNKNERA